MKDQDSVTITIRGNGAIDVDAAHMADGIEALALMARILPAIDEWEDEVMIRSAGVSVK